MANNPNNPEQDRKQNPTSNPPHHWNPNQQDPFNEEGKPSDKERNPYNQDTGLTDTKQPNPTNQPTRKTDPSSGAAFNDEGYATEDEFIDEEE